MGSGPKPSCRDFELVLILRTGTDSQRDDALRELMDRHTPSVFGAAFKIVKNTEGANDIVQAAFVKLVEKPPELQPDQSLGGWLHTVSHHLALDQIDKYKRFGAFSEDDGERAMWTSRRAAPVEHAEYKQMLRRIATLPLPLKVVAEPYLMHDVPVSVIAQKRGLTPAAVYARLKKAKAYLVRSRTKQR
ncbi:MAG: sigma-70 family RNA polymerase sigma factor [Acidobacteria bacterium]|nr:sigma-70 family RNA polymerase sigma factor [Acidobacteriota bacterium]